MKKDLNESKEQTVQRVEDLIKVVDTKMDDCVKLVEQMPKCLTPFSTL